MNFLAQFPSAGSPEAVNWFLITAFVALGAAAATANSLVGIWSKTRRRPPIDQQFASKDEVAALRDDVTTRLKSLEHGLHTLQIETLQAGEDRASRIHKRIDGQNEILAEVRASLARLEGSRDRSTTRTAPR